MNDLSESLDERIRLEWWPLRQHRGQRLLTTRRHLVVKRKPRSTRLAGEPGLVEATIVLQLLLLLLLQGAAAASVELEELGELGELEGRLRRRACFECGCGTQPKAV